eukprot:TRINITY_DN8021_c0_g2_i20.p1 TRINITY_DN8021_c0_g2~~TRINITY_DN8021_c0_g2_i20.p1  ORF type:complete len:864 (-),score=134.54 TRINITY_DN8021_c0_g2_i20:146-2692(-)
MAYKTNWMLRKSVCTAELAVTINDLWIGGRVKQAIYQAVLESERGKSNTKVGRLLTSKKFWHEPSFYMVKSRSNISNVYKVTQAIMAGALMTKSRIRRLTGVGTDLCNQCTEGKQESIYHALFECPSQRDRILTMRKAVGTMVGKHQIPPRWPIVLDDPTEDEERDSELIKGILSGGIPIQWQNSFESKYGKKSCERACRTSALISKTIAAIWGQRIDGHRNDLVELQRRRQVKMDEWTEMIMEEYYSEDWNILGDEEDKYANVSLAELLDMTKQTQGEEGEGEAEEDYIPTGNKQKRRRILSSKPREKWDQIPGIHLQKGEIPSSTQIYPPPEVTEDIAKRYVNKYNCEHINRGFCKTCRVDKLADHKKRNESKKRKEREWEKYKEGMERKTKRKTDETGERPTGGGCKANWRRVKEPAEKGEKEGNTGGGHRQQPKYNDKFQGDRTPVKPTNNRMKEYGQYSRPIRKYHRPLNSLKSLRRFKETDNTMYRVDGQTPDAPTTATMAITPEGASTPTHKTANTPANAMSTSKSRPHPLATTTNTLTLSPAKATTPTNNITTIPPKAQTPTSSTVLSPTKVQAPTYTIALTHTKVQTPTSSVALPPTKAQTPMSFTVLSPTRAQTPTSSIAMPSTKAQTPASSNVLLTPKAQTPTSTIAQSPTMVQTLTNTKALPPPKAHRPTRTAAGSPVSEQTPTNTTTQPPTKERAPTNDTTQPTAVQQTPTNITTLTITEAHAQKNPTTLPDTESHSATSTMTATKGSTITIPPRTTVQPHQALTGPSPRARTNHSPTTPNLKGDKGVRIPTKPPRFETREMMKKKNQETRKKEDQSIREIKGPPQESKGPPGMQ